MSERGKRLARWLVPAAWYAMIFWFSAQPGDASQEVSDGVLTHVFGVDLEGLAGRDWDLMLLASFLVRKAAHMGAFFLLTALLFWALKPWMAERRCRPWAALGLCAVLAAGDELHQYFVPGRSCMLRDVGIDLIGGGAFLLVWWTIRSLWARWKKRAGASRGETKQ